MTTNYTNFENALAGGYKRFADLNAKQRVKALALVEQHNQLAKDQGPRPSGSHADPAVLVEPGDCCFYFRSPHFVWQVGVEAYPAQNYKFDHAELAALRAAGGLRL